MDDKIIFPIRINRYLAKKQYCTRKEADILIVNGQVKINGKKAVLGEKVNKDDKVEVLRKKFSERKYFYLAFNKPKGVVTHSPQKKDKSIIDIVKYEKEFFPIGRLDKDSRGLIILTNDGRITERMLNPESDHEKEYLVEVDRSISPSFLKNLERGVRLENGYMTKPTRTEKISAYKFTIILTEGKKHQIRRMCDALGRKVADLKRVRIMNIDLGKLKPGELRKIEAHELDVFLNKLGIKKERN